MKRTLWAWLALAGCTGGTTPPTIDAPPITASVALVGGCAEPLASDGGILFATTSTVQTSTRDVDVLNDGGEMIYGPLALIAIEGPDASEFEIRTNKTMSSDCITSPPLEELAPGNTCHLAVKFRPTSAGEKQAVLHLHERLAFGDGDQTFALHATAVAAPTSLTASTPELDFPLFDPNGGSLSAITLADVGSTVVVIGDLVVPPPFTLHDSNCSEMLSPTNTCSFSIGLDPAIGCPMGTLTSTMGALSIALTGPGMPVHLDLTVDNLGSVVVSPGNKSYTNGEFDLSFDPLTPIMLTATPGPGVHLESWEQTSGASLGCGPGTICAFPANFVGASLRPVFASGSYERIAVTIVGTGSVTGFDTTCTSSCTLYAPPGSGGTLSASTTGAFTGWTGDCSGADPTCSFGTITGDHAVTATFSP